MVRYLVFLFLSIYFCFCSFQNIVAKEIVVDSDKQFKFADYLFGMQFFNRAILEYDRLIYYFPDHELTQLAHLRIADSYYLMNNQKQALNYLNLIVNNQNKFQNDIYFRLGVNFLDLNNPAPFQLREDSINQAINWFERIDYNYPLKTNIDNFLLEIKVDISSKYKNSTLAGVMSAIIPGSGSIYANRPKEGIYSFLIVTMFSLAYLETNSSQIDGRYQSLSPLLGGLSLLFYGGSIYTAINSTHLYNSRLENDRLLNARNNYNIWIY